MVKVLEVHPRDYSTAHLFVRVNADVAQAVCSKEEGMYSSPVDTDRLMPVQRRHLRCPICVTKLGAKPVVQVPDTTDQE